MADVRFQITDKARTDAKWPSTVPINTPVICVIRKWRGKFHTFIIEGLERVALADERGMTTLPAYVLSSTEERRARLK